MGQLAVTTCNRPCQSPHYLATLPEVVQLLLSQGHPRIRQDGDRIDRRQREWLAGTCSPISGILLKFDGSVVDWPDGAHPDLLPLSTALQGIFVFWSNLQCLWRTADRPSGREVPLSEFAKITSTVAPIAVDHQGQFASVTLSFNLPPNVSIGAAVSAIEQATKELHLPASITTSFQGSAQAFQNSLSSTPILILAALIAVYTIWDALREHDPPDHDHLDPALGRARGTADPDGVRHAARCDRHYRHHPLE